jgi:hypothetical protein
MVAIKLRCLCDNNTYSLNPLNNAFHKDLAYLKRRIFSRLGPTKDRSNHTL